jgi:hypothetical protein
MTGFRSLSVALFLALAVTAAGCADDDDNATAPTNPIAPTTPTATSFTITGSVSESEPSTHIKLEGATVSLQTGQSVQTNNQGNFTLSNIPPGAYIVTASRENYGEQILPLTLPADQGRVLNFGLTPEAAIIEVESEQQLSQDDAICHGSSLPCKRFEFGVHHTGMVEATLQWNTSDANLDLQVRCNEQIVATGTATSTVSEALSHEVHAGQLCEVRVQHTSGVPDRFLLQFSRPN